MSIALLYSQSHKHAFTLEYTAESKYNSLGLIKRHYYDVKINILFTSIGNRLILTGTNTGSEMSKSMNNTGGGILTSPFFPSRYPRDLGMEYIITCSNEIPSCRVRVLFSDFQLAAVSIMEVKKSKIS